MSRKPTRLLSLTGAGRAFCAGQDLAERHPAGEGTDLGITLDRLYNPLIRRLQRLERPVLCAVNGVAAGAGANLALACDIVAVDGHGRQEELRWLEMLRHELRVERLHAAAIERGAGVRYKRLPGDIPKG